MRCWKTWLVLLPLLLLAGIAIAQESIFGIEAPVVPPPLETGDEENTDPLEAMFQKLDLRGRIAQLMLVTMSGLHAPATDDLAFLKAYTPGGAIVRQITKPAAAAAYVTKLRGVETLTGIPLLVGANLYTLAQRDRGAPSAFIQLPSLLSIAAAQDVTTTEGIADLLARHMNLMGFNLHLGPSLSLSPSIAEAKGSIHSLGSDPRFVGEAGCALLAAFEAQGIIAMPMDFPGGAANRGEKSPAVLLTPEPQLAEMDALPYAKAIVQGVAMLHAGNTLAPTLDAGSQPASLSKAVLRDLLREKMGYTGVIVAGPMDDPDITRLYDPADAAAMALSNGADMIYWHEAGAQVIRTIERLAKAVERGELSEALIDASVRRVLQLKIDRVAPDRGPIKEKDIAELERARSLGKEVYALERRSITIVQNRGQILPLSKERSMPIAVTGVLQLEAFRDVMEDFAKPISQQKITTAQHLGDIQDFEIRRITENVHGIRTIVVVITDSLRPEGTITLLRELKSKGLQIVLVHLGYPRNVGRYTDADAIVLAYSDAATYDITLRAIAEVIMGDAPIRIVDIGHDLSAKVGEQRSFDVFEVCRAPAGRLPVRLSEAFPAGLAVPYPPDLGIRKTEWDFGNGQHSKETHVDFTYTAPGEYPVTLTITDAKKKTSSAIFRVVVTE